MSKGWFSNFKLIGYFKTSCTPKNPPSRSGILRSYFAFEVDPTIRKDEIEMAQKFSTFTELLLARVMRIGLSGPFELDVSFKLEGKKI